jgi:hypothetical protein
MLHADGLLIVPEGITEVEPGTQLEVLMLSWPEALPARDGVPVELGSEDCC